MAGPWEDYKTSESPNGPWNDYKKSQGKLSTQDPSTSGKAAALESFANTATLGYLPQLQAAAQKPIYGALNLITGNNVEADPYVQARDANIARQELQQKEHPYASTAGSAAGLLSSAVMTPSLGLAKGFGGLARVGEAAATSGLIGGIANPGDTKGEVNPMQLSERAKQAGYGMLAGGLIQGAGESVNLTAQKLKSMAAPLAVKAAGAGKPEFKKLIKQGRINDVGNFILDKDLVKGATAAEDVLENALAVKKEAGSKLSSIYEEALDKRTDPTFLSKLSNEELSKVNNLGFKPKSDGDLLKKQLMKEVEGRAKGAQSFKTVSSILDDFAQKGDQVTLPDAVKMKGDLDHIIDYDKEFRDLPLAQQMLKKVRSFISGKIDEEVEVLGKFVGQDKLKALKQANKEYGNSIVVENLAKNKMSGEQANRMFSLTDYLAGGALASGAGALSGGTPEDKLENALTYGLLGAGGNKVLRRLGPGTQAQLYNKIPDISVSPAVSGLLGAQATRGK